MLVGKTQFFRTIKKHLIILSSRIMYQLYYKEAADEVFVNRYYCYHCKKTSRVNVTKVRKRYQINYIEDKADLLHMNQVEIFVDFKKGHCSTCGRVIARPMFKVLNRESIGRAVGLFKRGKNIVAVKIYERKGA